MDKNMTDEEVKQLLKDMESVGIKGVLVGQKELDLMEKGEFSEETQEENK